MSRVVGGYASGTQQDLDGAALVRGPVGVGDLLQHASTSFGENSNVPGAELEIPRRRLILDEDVSQVTRESELYGSPAPVVDHVDPLTRWVGG